MYEESVESLEGFTSGRLVKFASQTLLNMRKRFSFASKNQLQSRKDELPFSSYIRVNSFLSSCIFKFRILFKCQFKNRNLIDLIFFSLLQCFIVTANDELGKILCCFSAWKSIKEDYRITLQTQLEGSFSRLVWILKLTVFLSVPAAYLW